MSDTTRDDARYRAVVARYRELLAMTVGHVTAFEAAEASPDGTLVAVVQRILDGLEGKGHTELHVLRTDGTARWPVTGADGDASGPRWSRDGARLTFLADHGTRHRPAPWLVDLGADGSPGEPRRLASPPGIPEHQRPSPDGERLLLVVAGEHAEQADGLGSGTVGEEGEAGDRAAWEPTVETTSGMDEWRSTWILDVASGDLQRVSPDGLNTWEADWLGPEAIVAVVSDEPVEDAWFGARVARIDVSSGEVTTLHAPEWQVQFAAGSPDGTHAAVIEAVASDRYFVDGDVMLVAADGSGVRPLPAPDIDVSAVRWVDDDRLVVLGITAGLRTAAGILGRDGSWTETWSGDPGPSGPYVQVSPCGSTGAVVTMLDGPEEHARVALVDAGEARTLLAADHPALPVFRASYASQRVVAWNAPDGTRIEGLLRLPHGDPPFAAVLWVHGGPVAAAGQYPPGVEMTQFAEAGYATLTPNPRGSTGRGRAFAKVVIGDMGGQDAEDLLSAVDYLVESGIADPARIAVGGFSYGGYMAALLPTMMDRFAAAIVSSPLTDLVSSYYGSSLSVFVRDYVGGSPATDAERYVARSAVFAGERLRTPTLITTGQRDRATPMGQAVELFRALREQGTDAQLVVYPQEGHGVSDLAARADWAGRSIAWLERYMPGRPVEPGRGDRD
jgi:dipeptidyl aminopeptidase/acylaminoacyl peptidase